MQTDDIPLVKKTLEGDREAFDELVRRHAHYLFNIARRFFSDRQTIEDVVQDAFMRAYTSLKSYKQKRPFKNWLAAITYNLCYRQLQKQGRREITETELSREEYHLLERFCVSPWSSEFKNPEERNLLRDLNDMVLSRLSPKDRMIIVLTEVEGLTMAETAEALGISVVNAKVTAYRARKNARRIMEGFSRSSFGSGRGES